MFMLVSVRSVGAQPGGHQHGVSLDISYTEYSSDLSLGEELGIFNSFHFPDSGLYQQYDETSLHVAVFPKSCWQMAKTTFCQMQKFIIGKAFKW